MQPIPIVAIPSHVYLSRDHQWQLFGEAYAMTIAGEHTQPGQVVYEESVQVFGKWKRGLSLRILGPNWKSSHVEVTPTEAAYLGLALAREVKSGDLSFAAPVRLVGPAGEVELKAGAMIPKPHLTASPKDAQRYGVSNGDVISVRLAGAEQVLEEVVVRVHPAFSLRVEVHQDYARDLWMIAREATEILR